MQSLHSFIDASRRHDIPGSETKELITHSTASSISFMFILVFLAPLPQSYIGEAQMDTAHLMGLCQLSHAKLAELQPYIIGHKQTCLLLAIEKQSLLYWTADKTVLCLGRETLSFKTALYTIIPETRGRNKSYQCCSAHKTCRNMRDPRGFSHMQHTSTKG